MFALTAAARRLGLLVTKGARAHCDTEDGPAVTDGRKALTTGNINYALKWVNAEAEPEVRATYDKAMKVRTLGADAAEVADRYFLETLVRLHRAGEGVGFEGIKPSGTSLPPQVLAADRAIAEGSIEPLRGLVSDQRWPELERRFHQALALKNFDVNDLDAARTYIAAYVNFFTYAEGEEREHAHEPSGPHGGAHAHGH